MLFYTNIKSSIRTHGIGGTVVPRGICTAFYVLCKCVIYHSLMDNFMSGFSVIFSFELLDFAFILNILLLEDTVSEFVSDVGGRALLSLLDREVSSFYIHS